MNRRSKGAKPKRRRPAKPAAARAGSKTGRKRSGRGKVTRASGASSPRKGAGQVPRARKRRPVARSSKPAAPTRRKSGPEDSAASRRAVSKPAAKGKLKVAAAADPARELRRVQSARRNLERQLTAAVQEIGILRQWEIRARLLEGELEKRNERLRELEERLGGADLVRQPRLL